MPIYQLLLPLIPATGVPAGVEACCLFEDRGLLGHAADTPFGLSGSVCSGCLGTLIAERFVIRSLGRAYCLGGFESVFPSRARAVPPTEFFLPLRLLLGLPVISQLCEEQTVLLPELLEGPSDCNAVAQFVKAVRQQIMILVKIVEFLVVFFVIRTNGGGSENAWEKSYVVLELAFALLKLNTVWPTATPKNGPVAQSADNAPLPV
mmetsp:Transcript_17082/g.31941  ORF Transcript_17082/g.31941 Transcript_17082/m.31941 type:complete len:206 (-) Transcript_17082:221-838(-)